MNIEIELSTKDTAYIIKNLYPLYLHDLSGHYGNLPNRHGVFEDTDEVKTLGEQYDIQNIWWEKPGVLYPYLVCVDERPAGFVLIATPPYCNQGIDYFVNEFFLLQPYRGKGIAGRTAHQVFDQHRGKWELFTNHLEANIAGKKFWRKTVTTYTDGAYIEELGETFDGTKVVFRFDNSVE